MAELGMEISNNYSSFMGIKSIIEMVELVILAVENFEENIYALLFFDL